MLVATGVFAKKTIPVRSQFGPLSAPIVSKTRLEVKPAEATTVWKKKHAMQKALETSSLSHSGTSEGSEAHQSGNSSAIVLNIKPGSPLHMKDLTSAGTSAEVAISSIQQQLMSITSQSISQSAVADPTFISMQPMHSSPVNQPAQLNFAQGLQELPSLSFHTAQGSIQLSHEHIQQLQQHCQALSQQDLSAFQHHLNINDATSPNHLAQMGIVEHPSAILTPIAHPLEEEGHHGDVSGVVASVQHNVSDSTEVTSDTELDDSADLDMSFELKVHFFHKKKLLSLLNGYGNNF